MKKISVFLAALSAIMICFVSLLNAQNAPNAPAAAPQNAAAQEPAEADEQPSDLGGWRVVDFKPYVKTIAELEKLSKEYSEKVLMQAVDEYNTGRDLLDDMDSELEIMKKKFSQKNNLNERWYWQEIDRLNQEKRQISKTKYEAKMRSVTYFTRAINHLDEVQSQEVRKSNAFSDFQIKLFQAYVSTQYDVQNLKPCIPILERYLKINEGTKKDVWAYKYLASCYGYMEAMLTKYPKQGNESLQFDFKQRKNRALLMASELKYGIDSVQYRHLKEVVELDERKSEKLNDFK